ncbi:hypothetical protein BU24DRAFT_460458 [Aaosphaeria arxii CBS 175.79]|uniref:Uncharacterized protein n=1 Tax=Aaosphaeria arxii CBS 175.79 TaxID=1450172 RepID=A0A6A5XWS6_9PLEO|nr:uncharacterized protein BU24DRAFT_460458 [Aaosphaeria arxii CBS 175.79]KAF2017409.1 hypothetical protein BU24DRAFT_460458 [Aaosphaeria arxii CBS 175.79]
MAAEGVTLNQYAMNLTGGERCGKNQLEAIRAGFHEMNVLFAASLPLNMSGEAEQEFFGPEARSSNFTELIEANLQRAIQYANGGGTGTVMPDIHVRCDDPNDYCDVGNKRDGKHVAYNIGNEPHINFCRRYFGLDGLEETVENVAANSTLNKDLMAYYNRATAWARQIMHISDVGEAIVEAASPQSTTEAVNNTWTLQEYRTPMNTSFLAGVANARPNTDNPNDVQTLKYGFGATRAKLLAGLSTQAPYDAANNAENYALFAQAKYIMQKKNFYPFMPAISFDDQVSLLADNDLQEGEKKRYACFDTTDVVKRNQRTKAIGDPIPNSAPGLSRRQIGGLDLGWAIAFLTILMIT